MACLSGCFRRLGRVLSARGLALLLPVLVLGTPTVAGFLPRAGAAAAATRFAVSAPSSATAGTPINVNITAEDASGATVTGFTGAETLTFSGPSDSPDGSAPTRAATVRFVNGVGTATVTLVDAQSTTLTVAKGVAGAGGRMILSPAPAVGLEGRVAAPVVAGIPGTLHLLAVALLKTAGGQGVAVTDITDPGFTATTGIVTVVPAAAARFKVDLSPVARAGAAIPVTIRAFDAFGNPATSYTGPKTLTFSGPANSPNGTPPIYPPAATFADGVADTAITFADVEQTHVTVTQAPVTGTSGLVSIEPGAVAALQGAPATATAGTATTLTVTATDADGNPATGYTGTMQLTSTDPAALLPAGATLTAGRGAFGVTFLTAGPQTLTGADTTDPALGATTGAVTVRPAAAATFHLSAPAAAAAGTPVGLTITALDAFGNTATGYTGTVHFTSTDPAAVLPAGSTLTAGTGTFPVTLCSRGPQSIGVTDSTNSLITSAATVSVSASSGTACERSAHR